MASSPGLQPENPLPTNIRAGWLETLLSKHEHFTWHLFTLLCIILIQIIEYYPKAAFLVAAFLAAAAIILWGQKQPPRTTQPRSQFLITLLLGLVLLLPPVILGGYLEHFAFPALVRLLYYFPLATQFTHPNLARALYWFPFTIFVGTIAFCLIKKVKQHSDTAMSIFAALSIGLSMIACTISLEILSWLPQLDPKDQIPVACDTVDLKRVGLTLQSTDVTKRSLVVPLAFSYLKASGVCKDSDRLFVYKGSSMKWMDAIQIQQWRESQQDTCGVGLEHLDNKIDSPVASRHLIGFSAVTFIVNSKRHISWLTKEQIQLIFSDDQQTWNDFGSEGGPIHVFLPPVHPGAANEVTIIQNFLFKEADLRRPYPCHEDVVECVAQDKDGIGFVDLTRVQSEKVTPIPIKAEGPYAVSASPENIANGKYPFVYGIYLQLPLNHNKCAEFDDFVLSAGQGILKDQGFVPRADRLAAAPLLKLDANYEDYLRLVEDGGFVEKIYPFRKGKPDLDQDMLNYLDIVATKLRENPKYKGKPVLLTGHADRSGNPSENGALSGNRAIMVGEALKDRHIPVFALGGFGTSFATAPRNDEKECEKDRKVEIWVWSGKQK